MVSDVADLPWPTLTADEWRILADAFKKVVAALRETSPVARIHAFRATRRELDAVAFRLLAVSPALQDVVHGELTRLA
jgi:hypothetical protein